MAKKKIQLQDANGNVLHPLTLGECVTMSNGENLDTLMSKSQMFTPTIAQDKSMFKVGTGVDVDYSANVKDGAYESLVFKGKSLVNLWKKHDTHNQRNFTLYEDGFMETVPNVLYFDHIQKANTEMIKPNTKYLLIVEVTKNTLPVPISLQSDNRTCFYENSGMMFRAGETGVVKKIITSISDLSTTRDDLRWGVYIQFAQANVSESERGIVKIRQTLIEYQQGMENWDIPYFTGLCDSKMPILRNMGKNLIPLPLIANTGLTWVDGVEHKPSSDYSFTSTGFIKIQTGVYYTSSNTSNMGKRVHCYDEGKRHLGVLKTDGSIVNSAANVCTSHTFKIDDKNVCYIRLTFYGVLEAAQLEESSTATSYEDHKTNILRTSEEIVLREVNGVQDTYNPLTGEYVQRIKERVFNGSETWVQNGQHTDGSYRHICNTYTDAKTSSNNVLCDKMSFVKVNSSTGEGMTSDIHITFTTTTGKVQIATTKPLSELKTWLSQNPITVQYELVEPVTTIIKPSTMTPFVYQNGHVIVESGFEGQSLLPEIEYSVVTGRTGQVTQNTKVLRKQEQQIISLEELLLTQVVQMEYERTLLQFDYELQMMMLG